MNITRNKLRKLRNMVKQTYKKRRGGRKNNKIKTSHKKENIQP